MIYETGTIKTIAGQTKITGTGTKWKDNLAGISEGSPLSYLINGTVYMNTVLSINSDTEINLTYPAPATSAGVKYQIVTVLLDSMSDGARKMLANQLYIQYFLRNMDTWMTQEGVVEIKTPSGEVVKFDSIIALKKMIDGKLDKALTLSVTNNDVTWKGQHAFTQVGVGDAGMVGKRAWITLNGISMNPTGNSFYSVTWPEKSGMLMQIGDYGMGIIDGMAIPNKDYNSIQRSGFYAGPGAAGGVLNQPPKSSLGDPLYGGAIMVSRSAQEGFLITAHNKEVLYRPRTSSIWRDYLQFYTTGNTIKDAQGNLRAASPIVKIFVDHIEINDESEGVQLEKLDVGRYKLKGVLGMNSDASWGGYHGGLVTPNGINNLPLVWADFKVEADGDIIIETHYRKHADLPPPVVLNRLITYPEFMDENGNELDSYTPCDIPNGHWIDVRVNMPSDSLYNQKQAEAQRLAEIEAERLAKEEAERIAEEAERAEQEGQDNLA
ncbi:MAG: hypothetical protein ACTH5W_15810 [Providencia sp.]|uniref:phage tail fiber protein n=1 Tax=Providencia sp. TaxID=589 RepID=UPI003F98384B